MPWWRGCSPTMRVARTACSTSTGTRKKSGRVRARVVVVAASCMDSTRILLNSKSRRHPNGIGNSSDVIGRYLSEQVRLHMFGFVPELLGAPVQNDDGIGGEHVYMPRFNHRDGRKRDYLRGFGMQFWGCGARRRRELGQADSGVRRGVQDGGQKRYPALVAMHPYGEVLPTRTTVSRWTAPRWTITACRSRGSISSIARTSAR